MAENMLRKKTKIITAIILGCMLYMLSGLSAAAFGDVDETTAKTEIDLIASYGIINGYEDGNFYPGNAISRAEMITIALRMLRIDDGATGSGAQTFSDVPSDLWSHGAIETAYSMGIINGYPDGTFRPDNPVSYMEALKIFVSVLGYEPAAKAKGGYPNGYLSIAIDNELLKLNGQSVDDNASREAVAVMAYNTLQSKMMTESHYIGNNIEYTVSDKTMLEIYFKSDFARGLLTATPVEGLYGKESPKNHISIDNENYLSDENYAELLGNKVKYFYSDDGGERKVVSVLEDPSRQTKIKITSDRFEKITGLYTSSGKVAYYPKENAKKLDVANLSPAISVIYNNKYVSQGNIGAAQLNVKNGTIELIDYDRDGLYDCMKILSYTDYFAANTKTNSTSRYVTDGTGSGFVYDVEDVYERITKNGASVKFEDITKNSIVSAAISADKKAVDIVLCEDTVEGSVTAKGTDNGYVTLQIGDEEFRVSKAIPERYVDDTLNVSGVFYKNFLGFIAYCAEKGSNGEKYGYLTAVAEKGGIGNKVEVRLLTENNRFAVVDVAKKVKVYDGATQSTLTPAEFYQRFYHEPVYNDIREAQTQVIKYKLDSDGALSLMRVASMTPSTEYFSVAHINPVSGEAEGRRYYANRLFLQSFQITDDTVCFEIPWTAEGEAYTRYTAGKAPTYFSDGNYYQVLMFDADEEKKLGAIMYTKYGQSKDFFFSIGPKSPCMIVKDVKGITDPESGIEKTVISGLVDGEYTSEVIDESFLPKMSADMLKFGSVIQYDTNDAKVKAAYYEGEKPAIAAATLLCADRKSARTVKWNGGNVEMISAGRKTTYGTVSKIAGFTVTVDLPDYPYGDSADYFFNDSTSVIIVNQEEKTLEIGDFYDILPQDRIFIRQRYNRMRDVVIYR